MQNIEFSPITIVLGEKGGVGQSLIAALAELIATEPSATGRGDVRVMSGRRRTGAPSGPRRRRTKKRRD